MESGSDPLGGRGYRQGPFGTDGADSVVISPLGR